MAQMDAFLGVAREIVLSPIRRKSRVLKYKKQG
jgi:hypothetical protein